MKLGFISDAHGNAESFAVGLEVLRRRGAEIVWFVGDAVGYLPGGAVIDMLGDIGISAVRGNHEQMMLLGAVPSDRESVYRLDETRRALDQHQLDLISSWPQQATLEVDGRVFRLMHGSPADPIFGYVYPDTDLAPFGPFDENDVIVMGNTHRPFVRQHDGVTFVNVGSTGMPRDHGALGAACVIDTESGGAEILRFDIAASTGRALARVGPVDHTVTEVFARRPLEYQGSLVEI